MDSYSGCPHRGLAGLWLPKTGSATVTFLVPSELEVRSVQCALDARPEFLYRASPNVKRAMFFPLLKKGQPSIQSTLTTKVSLPIEC